MSDLLIKMPLDFEPLRKNRFLLRFPSSLGIQEWWVVKAGAPHVKQEVKPIEFLNTKTYVIGKYSWEPISVTLRCPIGPSAPQAIMEWERLHSESVTGRQGYAAAYKRNVELELLDPTGVSVSKWLLVNCCISDLKFDELDYGSDELLNCEVQLQPDYCVLLY